MSKMECQPSVNNMDNTQNGRGQDSRPAANPDWQLITYKTMMSRVNFVLFNEFMSDVTFIVGCRHVRIPAHKFILSMGSNVFYAMFYGVLSADNEVQIPDIEPPAFCNVLQYLYIDKAEIEPDSVITTLYAAKKYAVLELERRCEELLGSSLKPENAFLLLTQARFFDASHLVALCLDMIDNRTHACLNAKCFLDIDYDTLEVVLLRDNLGVKEVCLFEAVMRWSKAECERQELPVTSKNQRRVLKECIRLIRYPLMSNPEFAQGPAQSGLLTKHEIADIFLHINSNPKPVCQFQDKPRRPITPGPETVCCRFSNHYVDFYCSRHTSCHRIIFQVDQNIFVSGFRLFEPLDHSEVNIELIHTTSKTIIASNKSKLARTGDYKTLHKILFKEPVDILANTNYCAVATIEGRTCGTIKGRRKVTVECDNGQKVTFQFFNDPDSTSTTVENGQIPEIIFHPEYC